MTGYESYIRYLLKHADEVEILLNEGKEYGLKSEKDTYDIKFGDERIYQLRIIKNGRIGSSTFYRLDELEKALKNAISLSKYSEKLDIHFPSGKETARKVKIYDKKIEKLNEMDGKRLINNLNRGVKRYGSLVFSAISYGTGKNEVVNSNNTFAKEGLTFFSANAVAKYFDGIGESSDSSRFLFDTYSIGKEAGEIAKQQKGQKKVTGNYTIILDKIALSTFLRDLLIPFFDGGSIVSGTSMLREKLNERLLSKELTVIDNPFNGSSAHQIDEEGVIKKEKVLVKNGLIKNFLFDTVTLAKAKKRKIRNIKSQTIGNYNCIPTNIELKPGRIKDIIKEFGDVILVRGLIGTHSLSLSRGDFIATIDYGLLFKNGKLIHPVKGLTFGENVIELLSRVLIEKKVNCFDNIISPRIGFENINCV